MRLALHPLALALVSALAFSSASTALSAADIKAVRIWPSYRTADSFERISEFFSGRENTGGQTLLRSDPSEREGFYFLTRIKNSGPALSSIRIELSVITPGSAEVRRFTFPRPDLPHPDAVGTANSTTGTIALPADGHVFQLGLTGAHWSEPTQQPVAWQIRFLDEAGQEIFQEQSFLWGQSPPK